MTTTDYLLNGLLIGLVLLQIRGRRLSLRSLVLPLGVVAFAASQYLHGIPTGGNDLVLVLLGSAAGALLGTGAGLATKVYRGGDGHPFAKAGVMAAVLWIVGVGSRLAFALYTSHGGAAAVGRFSIAHSITSGEAWVAALFLMAIAEVVSRNAVLAMRGWNLLRQPVGRAVGGGAMGSGDIITTTARPEAMIGAGGD